ncbi:MAG: ABC transporter substrate-binding protein [Verrucomicrobiota bacterium]
MKTVLQLTLAVIIAIGYLVGLVGCGKEMIGEKPVLRVGIIASLSGPGQSWGEATLSCARAMAAYHNERGGILIDGQKVPIEFVIKDDALEPGRAVEAAYLLAEDNLRYVIGPLGDDAIVAAAPVLDAAGILFIHYGFQPEVISSSSLGILGMPIAEQSMPVLFDYLASEKSVQTLAILARDVEEAIYQKGIAQSLAESVGIEVQRFSKFDVSEETLPPNKTREQLAERAALITAASPEALLLVGFPPSEFSSIVIQLRETGFEGIIATQNAQDIDMLQKIGPDANRLYFVGGTLPLDQRSDYYLDLRRRYLEMTGYWSDEVDTKFYALELIFQSVQKVGLAALEQTSEFYQIFDEAEFEDPFFKDERTFTLTGETSFGANRQICIPILISEFSEGEPHAVIISKLPD